jgi:hypothetical protein
MDLTEEVEGLAQAVAATEGASLLGVFDAWPRHITSFQIFPLRPFELEASARLIESLAVQMELDFEQAAIERLHRASGGHPLILRQLASLAVAYKSGGNGRVDVTDVDTAVSQYVSQADSALSHLWDSLTPEEQRALRMAIGAEPPLAGDPLDTLVDLGWLHQVDGRWQLFSQALERWLRAHRPAQA